MRRELSDARVLLRERTHYARRDAVMRNCDLVVGEEVEPEVLQGG